MASRKQDEMKKRLLEERDKLLRERDAIDNQVAGLERAIALIGGEENASSGGASKRNTSLKSTVLDLLEDVGTTGLNASSAVALADSRGLTLDRGSVSSLLSRLKKDDVVVHDGEKYRLKKFAPHEGASDDPFEASLDSAVAHLHRR